MQLFRILLLVQTVAIVVYTFSVGLTEGWDLLPVFVGEITRGTWSGQFNLDFFLLLILASLWVLWRNRFSPQAYLLAAGALVGGTTFLAPYLFLLTLQERGNVRAVLTGNN